MSRPSGGILRRDVSRDTGPPSTCRRFEGEVFHWRNGTHETAVHTPGMLSSQKAADGSLFLWPGIENEEQKPCFCLCKQK